ncbi:hypothetical protein RM812_40395 [Streptomyces sp. DSM 40712]|uniref:Uncharacterized protein n=1 Tax=Streptomyces lancefieldiae TaxID=3075520 RepID=A0ABU3B1M5_9ACTN|nr:hypothetical protein [Streptomyces sp. DSM 40712]MDT0616354.1 hypothetical protein [Streptomyces sp. DSM 40712]
MLQHEQAKPREAAVMLGRAQQFAGDALSPDVGRDRNTPDVQGWVSVQ